ncbi:MAG: ABC transporter ATP-binding protein [Deltaproteobacteria bacterium]|nr:ABC transporter ATP-binding protein [Deltaproteobacteria bacterium]
MRVELQSIDKRYGKVKALSDVSLDIRSGSRVALIGPNGSGKTTLTRVVMGLVAHGGDVRLDGAPAARARTLLARDIAYVPQVAPQMAATVGEIVRLVASGRGRGVDGILAVMRRLDLDFAAIRDRSFRGLSGGMKQKVLIAMALGVEPRLVILDEPTASLDAGARARFAELERELLGAATVILCSHRLDELRTMVDRVVSMADGSVIHDGEARAFVADHTRTVIELRLARAEHAEDAAWLGGRGFTKTGGGWWSAAVGHDDKLRLLPEVMATLGAALDDIVVRDLDRLVVPPTRPELAGGAS